MGDKDFHSQSLLLIQFRFSMHVPLPWATEWEDYKQVDDVETTIHAEKVWSLDVCNPRLRGIQLLLSSKPIKEINYSYIFIVWVERVIEMYGTGRKIILHLKVMLTKCEFRNSHLDKNYWKLVCCTLTLHLRVDFWSRVFANLMSPFFRMLWSALYRH